MKRYKCFRRVRAGGGFAAPYVVQSRVIELPDTDPQPNDSILVDNEIPLAPEWANEPDPPATDAPVHGGAN